MPGVIQKAAMKFIFQKGKSSSELCTQKCTRLNTKQEGIQKFANEEPSNEPSPSSHSYAEWMILADLSLTTSDSMEKEQIMIGIQHPSHTHQQFSGHTVICKICNLWNENVPMICKIEICNLQNGNMLIIFKIEICNLWNGNILMICKMEIC